MATFKCTCGNVLSNSATDGTEIYVLTDETIDQMLDCYEKISLCDISDWSPALWHCKKCQRVHMFKDNKRIRTYKYELEIEK